jgi:hypothetical protein
MKAFTHAGSGRDSTIKKHTFSGCFQSEQHTPVLGCGAFCGALLVFLLPTADW